VKLGTDSGGIKLLNQPLDQFLSMLCDKVLTDGLVGSRKIMAHLVELGENLLLRRILREVCVELLNNKSAESALRCANRSDGLNGNLRNAQGGFLKKNIKKIKCITKIKSIIYKKCLRKKRLKRKEKRRPLQWRCKGGAQHRL
jgi:hypothetical protein